MIIDDLVFDRTREDVDRVKELKLKIMTQGLSALTEDEEAEYLAGMKGAYNYTDLNRVGEAVDYLATQLSSLSTRLEDYREALDVADDSSVSVPYSASDISVTPKTDWTMSDIPTQTQIATYLGNIANLRSLLDLPSGTPTVPSNLNSMDYTTANDLERILYIIYTRMAVLESQLFEAIDRATLDRVYSGEISAGEV